MDILNITCCIVFFRKSVELVIDFGSVIIVSITCSLLRLLLSLSVFMVSAYVICITCIPCYFLRSPAARRRRQKRSTDEKEYGPVYQFYMKNRIQRRRSFHRIPPSSLSCNQSAGKRTLRTECSVISSSSVGDYLNLPDSVISLTNVEKKRNQSAVSVKKLPQSEIANMTNIHQLNPNKAKGDDHHLDNDSIYPSSTVNVIRVMRVPNLTGTDNDNSDLDEKNISSRKWKKFDRVRITKLPRSKSSRTQRPGSTSIEQFSMEMKPITDHAKRSAASSSDRQGYTNNGVKVNRVSRRIVSTRSYNH